MINKLQMVNTGTYNPASLGIQHVRPLTMARGSREGINAFKSLLSHESVLLSENNMKTVVKYAISKGHDYQFIKYLVSPFIFLMGSLFGLASNLDFKQVKHLFCDLKYFSSFLGCKALTV